MTGYAFGVVTGSEPGAEEVRTNLGKVWEKGKLRFRETEVTACSKRSTVSGSTEDSDLRDSMS